MLRYEQFNEEALDARSSRKHVRVCPSCASTVGNKADDAVKRVHHCEFCKVYHCDDCTTFYNMDVGRVFICAGCDRTD